MTESGKGRPGPVPSDGESPGWIQRRSIYQGRIIDLSLDRVRFPGGSTGELEFIRHSGASAVLPFLDPPESEDPRVLMIRQYRYAAGGYLYEIPAGMPTNPGEAWEACARRELKEETGRDAGSLRYLSRILTTPGFTDEVIHLFAAADLEDGAADRDSDEFLEVVEMPFSQALEGVRTGPIIDCKTVAALLYADRFLPRAWSENVPPPTR
jgi:ADP-ribose pyrophosphatase